MDSNIKKDDFYTKTSHITTLFNFIKNNKEDQFLEYLTSLSVDEVDVNMKDENGNYLIFFAIILNNRRILRKLMEYNCRLDVIDSEGYNILYYPIKYNYTEIIDILLEYDKKSMGISLVNLKDARGAVPLFYAIRFKNKHALQELLSNGADANYRNSENMNALHLAVLKKDVIMVKMVIKYVKNIDTRSNSGSTALHYACNFQLTDIVKILLDNGASQNIIELEYDLYPIFYSVVQNNITITKMLILNGANPNFQDYMGNTIIHYAILNNHLEILDFIFSHYEIRDSKFNMYVEDINSKNAISGDYIDPNIVNIEGLTITHLLLYNYRHEYDKYLIKILPFTNLNYQDNIGNTILHIIAENNLWKIFEHILDMKKMNIFIRNNQNNTIFDMINIADRTSFIDMVVKSYYRYLQKNHGIWLLEWQNKCSDSQDTEANCYTLIKNAIINEQISIPQKKDKINITVVNEAIVHFSTFTGSILDVITGFKYLTKKYPLATSLFHSNQEYASDLEKYNQSLGIQENPHQHIIHFEIRWLYQRIFMPPGFENIMKNIINNNKYRYVIIPIGIILSNGSHSNALFYDIAENIMERFEPHGSDYPSQFNYNPDLLDEILHKKMNAIISAIYGKNIKIKYYKPKNYLPKIGFQTFESAEINVNKNIGDPNGFCTLWCIWYLDYRLRYVDKKPQSLVKNLIHQIRINNYSFRTIIRNYSHNITSLRDIYLTRINRNINDYLNNRLTSPELKQLLIEILSDN